MNLYELISQAQNLPAIPKIVQELIDSFGDDNINSDEIAEKLSKDQAMTAKVLRMANSSRYGGHRQVGTVNDAVVLLGFNALRTMVLASGLSAAMPAPNGFDINKFWHTSFAIASTCKWISKFTKEVDGEIAFTGGMLHDIGGLLTHILVNEEAQEIDRVIAKGADRIEMESSRLGFTYPEAGAELANRWKFPEVIVEGIAHQLAPNAEDGNYKPLAGVILIASYLYANIDKPVDEIIKDLPSEHLQALKIDQVSMIDQIDAIKSIDSEVSEFLS